MSLLRTVSAARAADWSFLVQSMNGIIWLLNSWLAHAAGKDPVSLERKTYENTKEKLGQSSAEETAPVGAQPAFA